MVDSLIVVNSISDIKLGAEKALFIAGLHNSVRLLYISYSTH